MYMYMRASERERETHHGDERLLWKEHDQQPEETEQDLEYPHTHKDGRPGVVAALCEKAILTEVDYGVHTNGEHYCTECLGGGGEGGREGGREREEREREEREGGREGGRKKGTRERGKEGGREEEWWKREGGKR